MRGFVNSVSSSRFLVNSFVACNTHSSGFFFVISLMSLSLRLMGELC